MGGETVGTGSPAIESYATRTRKKTRGISKWEWKPATHRDRHRRGSSTQVRSSGTTILGRLPTRATFHAYADFPFRQEPEGFSDNEDWQAHKRKQQGVPLSKQASPSPQRPAWASSSGEGTQPPSPAGPDSAPPPAATQSCPPSEVPSSKASEGAGESWSVSEDSAFGPPDDEAALKELQHKMDATRLESHGQGGGQSSAASACSSSATGAGWSLVENTQRQKRKRHTDVSREPATAKKPADARSTASCVSQASKLSHTSAASIARAAAFLNKHPPP